MKTCIPAFFLAASLALAGPAKSGDDADKGGDDEAKKRAEGYLDAHEIVELWTDHRLVGRIKRN